MRDQRKGQEVGHAKHAESEERASGWTSCPQDLAPPFALVTGLSFQSRTVRSTAGDSSRRLRLVYRLETVSLPQRFGCTPDVLEHILCAFHEGSLLPRCSLQRLVYV